MPAPPGLDASRLCALVSGGPRGRLVWGEGNPDAPCLLVFDNPGAREDAEGRPFVCGTRETLRVAMAEAGLAADAVFVTYLYKCRPRGRYDREAATAAHLPILREQAARSPARVIVTFGDRVARALFGPDASVRAMRGSWYEWSGRPLRVAYHPLAARRRPNLLPLLVADLAAAAVRLRG